MRRLITKWYRLGFVRSIFLLLLITSCDSNEDENITITVMDFETVIEERPEQGFVLGKIIAATNGGALKFSILSQDPNGAIQIDMTTGELSVADPLQFNDKDNPLIHAVVEVSDGKIVEMAQVTIILEEFTTVSVFSFEVIIEEKPEHGLVLGTIVATTNKGELEFTILSQHPDGAIQINHATGEISVANASLFNFDDNPIINAVVEVSSGEVVEMAQVTVTLKKKMDEDTGSKIVFEKLDFADHKLEANQDRITDQVWITRGATRGLFNIKKEDKFSDTSPVDTEWAEGTTENIEGLEFKSWRDAVNNAPTSAIGKDFVLHLISEDIYIDIKLLSWTMGVNGGGFSYMRSPP